MEAGASDSSDPSSPDGNGDGSQGGPGDRPYRAADLVPMVYRELRELAVARMGGERKHHTLQPTALVHEAYMRLEQAGVRFASQAHFFSIAADAMRRVLIEHARSRGTKKRGGTARRVAISVVELAASEDPTDLLDFDDALTRLSAEQPLASEVVRLRVYAGLTIEDTARALNIAERTVNREWRYARAWLYRVLGAESSDIFGSVSDDSTPA
jgi:RNA polymerase sigma factor (TIGR02999 family)